MIRKIFDATQTKVLGDPEQGLVEAIFSATGNIDKQNDRIVPGAFSKALAAKSSVPVVYAHKWDDINAVLGRTTSWAELMPGSPGLPDSLRSQGYGGVKATIQFEMGVPSGRAAFTHLKNGNLGQYSFAFDIDNDGEKFEGNVREIKSIREIYEVTVALIGANQLTTTMVAKAKADEDSQWARIKSHIADQISREERPERTQAHPVSETSQGHGVTVSAPRLGDPGYFEHLHAMKAAEFKALQEHYAEVRREMGLPPQHGR